jgi:uncharacterized membrane protein YczE
VNRLQKFFIVPSWRQLLFRLPQCLFGMAIIGVAFPVLVRADLGLGPWEVLSDGIHRQLGIALGTAAMIVAAATLAVWIPLRQRIGVGTLVAVLVFGPVVNLVLPIVPDAHGVIERCAYLAVSILLWGAGVAIYLNAELGPGPRDGIMAAVSAKGYSVRVVRTLKELIVLAIGFLLGGSVGIGTAVYALGIGHSVHLFLSLLPKRSIGGVDGSKHQSRTELPQ